MLASVRPRQFRKLSLGEASRGTTPSVPQHTGTELSRAFGSEERRAEVKSALHRLKTGCAHRRMIAS